MTRVALAAPGPLTGDAGGADATGGPGRATLEPATSGSSPVVRLLAPGSATEEAAAEDGPLLARATGRSAPGLAASQLTRSSQVAMRGLAGTTCATSGTDFWFVGSGAVVGQRGRRLPHQPRVRRPPSVDVTLYGPAGAIDAPDGRGVSVAARGQEVRLLDALAPAFRGSRVHVQVRQGRVSAALRDQQIAASPRWAPTGCPSRGTARDPSCWCPACRLAPASAGCRCRAGRRRRASSGSGCSASRRPSPRPGWTSSRSRAGSVSDVDLAPYAGGEAVAVELDVRRTDHCRRARPRVRDGRPARRRSPTPPRSDPLTPADPGGRRRSVRPAESLTSTPAARRAGRPAVVELAPAAAGATGTPTEVSVPGRQPGRGRPRSTSQRGADLRVDRDPAARLGPGARRPVRSTRPTAAARC